MEFVHIRVDIPCIKMEVEESLLAEMNNEIYYAVKDLVESREDEIIQTVKDEYELEIDQLKEKGENTQELEESLRLLDEVEIYVDQA